MATSVLGSNSRPAGPRIGPAPIADALLEAAIGARAETVWIEPIPSSPDLYTISFECRRGHIGSTTIGATIANAVIARLALICGSDLAAPRASTGRTRARSMDGERELVVTVRPGQQLRAEVVLLERDIQVPRAARTGRFQDPVVGDCIGHYRVIGEIGAGGMGKVYQVTHEVLGRVQALKVLHGSVLQNNDTSVERFLTEARATSRIRHPHIVDVFDFGYLGDGRPYFVMELLAGSSLADRIDRGALPPNLAVTIARQLGEALASAHDHGVIHADVTPSNVMILDGRETHVKLVDFGLAEFNDRGVSRAVTTEFVLGTPWYISPEQVVGGAAGEHSDQYAAGVVLFEMLTGQAPFDDDNIRTICMKHITAPVPPVVSPHGPLPLELVRVVQRCLEKTPQARFPNMQYFVAELAAATKLLDRPAWRRWVP